MAYTSKLKEWGAVAEERSEFPDGYRYTKENPPVTHYDNFLVHNLIEDVQHLVDLTNAIDPDNDGQVADAETALLINEGGVADAHTVAHVLTAE